MAKDADGNLSHGRRGIYPTYVALRKVREKLDVLNAIGRSRTDGPLSATLGHSVDETASVRFRPIADISAGCIFASVDEQKVLITPDGYGRIAIVRRDDCRYCLYEHWRWDLKTQIAFHVEPVRDRRWTHKDYDREALYEGEGIDPLPGLFATLEDAEREARSLTGFADAIEEAK